MMTKLINRGLLAAIAAPMFLMVGCASQHSNDPYALTGDSTYTDTSASIDQQHQQWVNQQRYTDEKGRFRPEFADQHQPLK